jgi:hypothetical protein
MKPRLSTRRNSAMTLFEVGILVAVVLVLLIVFLPRITAPRRTYAGVACVNNLKQLGLAYRVWAGDNNDQYPTGVSVTNGGSMELVQMGDVVQTFLVMSNELSTPKILYCPADRTRTPALSFSSWVGNRNLSYFVGLDATNDLSPLLVLSGDSHLTRSNLPPLPPGLHTLGTNELVGWTNQRHIDSRHFDQGNIGLADGSVQTTDSTSLREFLTETGRATNSFAIP